MTINERLFYTINQKNIKLTDLARILNVNKTVISAWKNRGTNPPVEYTVQICELLGISIEYYLTGNETGDYTSEEKQIINAYRQADPAIQTATKKLLDVEIEQERLSNSRTG